MVISNIILFKSICKGAFYICTFSPFPCKKSLKMQKGGNLSPGDSVGSTLMRINLTRTYKKWTANQPSRASILSVAFSYRGKVEAGYEGEGEQYLNVVGTKWDGNYEPTVSDESAREYLLPEECKRRGRRTEREREREEVLSWKACCTFPQSVRADNEEQKGNDY